MLNHSLSIFSVLNIIRISSSGPALFRSSKFSYAMHYSFSLTFLGHKSRALKEIQDLRTLCPVSSVQSPGACLRNKKQTFTKSKSPWGHCLLALCLHEIAFTRDSRPIPQFKEDEAVDVQLSSVPYEDTVIPNIGEN